MKRIAIFIVSMRAGGAERVVSYLLNEVKQDIEVHLILLDKTIEYQLPNNPNIRIVELGKSFGSRYLAVLNMPLLARRLKAYLVDNKIQAVLSLLNRPNLIACLAKRSGWTGKLIISERTDTLAYYRSLRFGSVMIALIKKCYRYADAVTVISKGIGFSLNKLGIKNPIVIYNPIYASQRRTELKTHSPFTFISIGRLEAGKNHALLINAFAKLEDRTSRLVIVGSGDALSTLKHLAMKLEVADRILFAGQQSDVGSWLENADCMVFSSNLEGFGNVILEAMNLQVPVISTDCPFGPREILAPKTDPRLLRIEGVEHADYGVLVPVKNVGYLKQAMQEMMTDQDLRSRYQQLGPRRAADFNVEDISKQYFDLM